MHLVVALRYPGVHSLSHMVSAGRKIGECMAVPPCFGRGNRVSVCVGATWHAQMSHIDLTLSANGPAEPSEHVCQDEAWRSVHRLVERGSARCLSVYQLPTHLETTFIRCTVLLRIDWCLWWDVWRTGSGAPCSHVTGEHASADVRVFCSEFGKVRLQHILTCRL